MGLRGVFGYCGGMSLEKVVCLSAVDWSKNYFSGFGAWKRYIKKLWVCNVCKNCSVYVFKFCGAYFGKKHKCFLKDNVKEPL